MIPFVETHLTQFFTALSTNLGSTNSQVNRITDATICELYNNLNKQ